MIQTILATIATFTTGTFYVLALCSREVSERVVLWGLVAFIASGLWLGGALTS